MTPFIKHIYIYIYFTLDILLINCFQIIMPWKFGSYISGLNKTEKKSNLFSQLTKIRKSAGTKNNMGLQPITISHFVFLCPVS